jgi:hypothetical protein
MTIVVEIASRTGTRAYKEYDAPSVDAAIKEANRELQAYPEFGRAEPPWRAPFF